MNDRNSEQRCGFTQDQRRKQRANDAVDRESYRRSYNIKREMHKCGAACVFVRTDRGYQRRNAGTDILTHYDRNSRTVGHRTGGGKRLKNADGGRAGLNYSGQQRTDDGF